MNPFMMMALGGREPITQTFTGNATWVAPDGVTSLVSLEGRGANGTFPTTVSATAAVIDIVYRTDTSTGSGNADWSNFQGVVTPVIADFNPDGAASWNQYIVQVWPDGSNSVATYPISISGGVPGSATASTDAGWQTSGAIANSGSNFLSYTDNVPSAAGANATAFGKTFMGGAPSSSAVAVPYYNEPVTPHSSYNIVVPAGGSVTIIY